MKNNNSSQLEFNVDLKISSVKLDAFRSNISADVFQSASDCKVTSSTNDLIPIIVGCVLAAMVVIVLIAYLVGRKYNSNNYTNMDD